MRWSLSPRSALAEPLVLYSRPDCSLCATAARLVRNAVGTRGMRVMDVVGNRALEDAYIFRIPVLCYRDVVLAEGLIDERDVRRALGAAERLDRRTD